MPQAHVVFNDTSHEEGILCLRPNANLVTGERHFKDTFGNPTSLESDVLTLASAIFACDLAFKRGERENIARRIALTIPVVNLAAFNNVQNDIRRALHLLSHDAWNITFIQRLGSPEVHQEWSTEHGGKVLLFSGGLDSFAAALHYKDTEETMTLVSHFTANVVVREAQKRLYEYLDQQCPSRFAHITYRVGGRSVQYYPFPADQEREETQRTRSFLFLTLAALTARRCGLTDVVLIAENGQLAINLPLTTARIGAFSTHTAHPEFVHLMSDILSTLLAYRIQIENPFLYCTKAEVISAVVHGCRLMISHTVSCWKASRVTGRYHHCGMCVPCLVRRIALETHGVLDREYKRDLFREDIAKLSPEDDGKRNLVELAEFVRRFEQGSSQASFEDDYPDLISTRFDAVQVVEMYRRFAGEARAIFDRYSTLQAVLR